MDLRVTSESETFVYATSTLRIGGLDPEDYIFLLFPMATLNTVGFQPMGSLLAGIFCLWLYKQLTSHHPPGFLPTLLGIWAGELLHSRLGQQVPAIRRLALFIVRVVNRIWISSGLLPLPSYCKLYER